MAGLKQKGQVRRFCVPMLNRLCLPNFSHWRTYKTTRKVSQFESCSFSFSSNFNRFPNDSIYDDRLLEINGIWNVMTNRDEPIQKRVTVKFFLLDNVQSSISKSVRNTFQFVDPGHSETSQGKFTVYTEFMNQIFLTFYKKL